MRISEKEIAQNRATATAKKMETQRTITLPLNEDIQVKAVSYPWKQGDKTDPNKSDYRSFIAKIPWALTKVSPKDKSITNNKTVTEGKKNSEGKLDWSRLPFESLVGVVRVMEKGGSKYGGYRTWLPGIMFSGLFAAIMRHLINWFVFMKDKDKESGEHPLCHVIANCMMLLTYINDKTFDDR